MMYYVTLANSSIFEPYFMCFILVYDHSNYIFGSRSFIFIQRYIYYIYRLRLLGHCDLYSQSSSYIFSSHRSNYTSFQRYFKFYTMMYLSSCIMHEIYLGSHISVFLSNAFNNHYTSCHKNLQCCTHIYIYISYICILVIVYFDLYS